MSCGSCGNTNVSSTPLDINADRIHPRIKAYSGWASYKNVKSGDYNRQVCWNCSKFKGFPQEPGLYNLNIDNSMPKFPMPKKFISPEYQKARMCGTNGSCFGEYRNYLNEECLNLYPKRYVKGNWPDEQLIFTNTPRNSCHTTN